MEPDPLIYKKNLKRLSLRYPELYERIDVPGEDLIPTQDGNYTCLVEGTLLYSRYNLMRAIRGRVESLRFDPNRLTLLLGIGLGYFLEEIINTYPVKYPIFAIERRVQLFKALLCRSGVDGLIDNPKIHLIVGKEIKEVLRIIREGTRDLTCLRWQIFTHPTLYSIDFEYYEGLLRGSPRRIRSHLPDEPKVSIIMPTWNRGYIIERAIRSVLAQSYRNLELIVVDDGSWDSTKEVVKRFGDRRIRYRYIPHSGTPRALNAGLDLARGELIGYLASDDEWETDFLKFMVKGIIANPEVGLVYCGYRVYEPNNSHPKIVRPRFDFIKALYRFYITMCGILHRRECIEEIGGFDERLLRGQDWDFLIRLFDAYKTGFVDRILCTIYQREEYKGPVSECGVILEEKIQDFLRKRLTYSV